MNLAEHKKAFDKFIANYNLTNFFCLYMAGVRTEKWDMSKKLMQLKGEIERTGFAKEEVLMCLEEWIKECEI